MGMMPGAAGGMPGMMPNAQGAGMGMPGMGGMGTPMTLNPSYVDQEVFMEVGHGIWMLFFSWLGGTVALGLYRTREKSSTAGTAARATSG
jgi:hypothetical protein